MKVFKFLTFLPFEKSIKNACSSKGKIVTPHNSMAMKKQTKLTNLPIYLLKIFWFPFWILFLVCATNIIVTFLNGLF